MVSNIKELFLNQLYFIKASEQEEFNLLLINIVPPYILERILKEWLEYKTLSYKE